MGVSAMPVLLGFTGFHHLAHIMISGMRGLGLPAAYVSGYLRTAQSAGEERLEGAGAMHAGWRGVIAGIASVGIRDMVQLGARVSDIRAAMGPSIGPCCFEVDAELGDRFGREIVGARNHTRAGRPGKAFIDLRAIVRDQLERAGLAPANITSVGPCTRCASDRFFSRRAAGGKTTGLQMSFIGFRV